MEDLSKEQESFSENAGIFGVLISLTCLIQHFIFMIPNWRTYCIIVLYCLSIVGFALLVKKSAKAFPFILASAILIFLLEAYMIISRVFSLVLLLLLIYSILIIVFMNVNGVQKQLKQKEINEKAEKEKWSSII